MFELLGVLLGFEILDKGCLGVIFNFIMFIIKFFIAHIVAVMITELSGLNLFWYFILLLIAYKICGLFSKKIAVSIYNSFRG